jgi:hypothetical protein
MQIEPIDIHKLYSRGYKRVPTRFLSACKEISRCEQDAAALSYPGYKNVSVDKRAQQQK